MCCERKHQQPKTCCSSGRAAAVALTHPGRFLDLCWHGTAAVSAVLMAKGEPAFSSEVRALQLTNQTADETFQNEKEKSKLLKPKVEWSKYLPWEWWGQVYMSPSPIMMYPNEDSTDSCACGRGGHRKEHKSCLYLFFKTLLRTKTVENTNKT